MTTVREIMCGEVVTVQPELTMLGLTRVLAEASIGGAPVVDRSGRLVGVISATDVLRLAAQDAEAAAGIYPFDPLATLDPDASGSGDPGWFYFGTDLPGTGRRIDPGELPTGSLLDRTVGEMMSGRLFAVAPDTTVQDLADFLLEKRIHRALVTEGEELVGIVSTFDVLRAVA